MQTNFEDFQEETDFEDFQNQMDFAAVMSGRGLDSYSNYSGGDFAGWLCGPIRTRDASLLAQSNYKCALDTLLAVDNADADVQVQSCSHWACGYFDRILVRRDTLAAYELHKIYIALADYPVLDDLDFSQREYDAACDYAEANQDTLAEALALHFHLTVTPTLTYLAYDLNVIDQIANGVEDSCIDVYPRRVPSASALRDLERALESCLYERRWHRNRTARALRARINAYRADMLEGSAHENA